MSSSISGAINITVNNGMFEINGEVMDLGTAMMRLNMDRTNLLDVQIADKMKEIQERNNRIKQLTELIAAMRSMKAEGKDDNTYDRVTISGTDGRARNIQDWGRYFGLDMNKWTDIPGRGTGDKQKTAWDANISFVQGIIDGLNSDSQMSMTQLQSLMNKRNTASDMTTNILSADKKTMDTITGNLR